LDVPTESRISKTLSERTTKIVIILVLLMLFFQPLFDASTFLNYPAMTDQGLLFLIDMYQSGDWKAYQNTVLAFIAEIGADPVYPMIELNVPDYTSPVPTSNIYTWT